MTSSHHEASPSRDPVAVQEGRPPDQLISIGDIRALFKLGRTAAYELTRRPDFPVPVQVSRRCLRWRGRSLWSRPVAQEWAEQRQRSPDGVDAVVSAPGGRGEPVPAGQARAAAALTRSFMAGLWEYRPFRSRWALRWRTRGHVEENATDLAGDAASYMVRDLIPADALAATVRHAFLDEIAEGIRLSGRAPADETFYGITPKVARMLGWLALHRPHMAGFAISEIIGDAEGRLGVPRRVTEQAIQTALDLDGGMDDYLDEFLDRVLTPPPACRHQISSSPPPDPRPFD